MCVIENYGVCMKKVLPNEILLQENVMSSTSDNVYIVTLYDNCLSCTCPAGGRKTFCKHMQSIVYNNLELIKEKNIEFYNNLVQLLEMKNDKNHNVDVFKEICQSVIYTDRSISQEAYKNTLDYSEKQSTKQTTNKSEPQSTTIQIDLSQALNNCANKVIKIQDVANFNKNKNLILAIGILGLFAFFPMGVIILAYYYFKSKQCETVVDNFIQKDSNYFRLPKEFETYFTKDEISEIEYNENNEKSKFLEDDYDITYDWYQNCFEKAKRSDFVTVFTDKDLKYSVLQKGDKYYFASLKGCSCKKYQENEFCEHMVLNAINLNVISSTTGVLNDIEDADMKRYIDFIYANMVNAPENILKISTGLVKRNTSLNYFEEKGLIRISTNLEDMISELSLDDLKKFIPNLKKDIPQISPDLRISKMKAYEIKDFIVSNQDFFQQYFNNYVHVDFNNELEELIENVEELASWILYAEKKYNR